MTSRILHGPDLGIDPRVGVPKAEEPDGDFAPCAERYKVCKSIAGRWRGAHGWISTEVGAACMYCNCLKDTLVLKP